MVWYQIKCGISMCICSYGDRQLEYLSIHFPTYHITRTKSKHHACKQNSVQTARTQQTVLRAGCMKCFGGLVYHGTRRRSDISLLAFAVLDRPQLDSAYYCMHPIAGARRRQQ